MSDPKTVLIVEDEKNIVDILRFNLQRAGYQTLEAYDGEDGLAQAVSANPDLILLDVMLPKKNGFDVCRALRDQGSSVPVIILTAREEEADKVLGLEIGADDYITKPFSMRELVARVGANIRRTTMTPPAAASAAASAMPVSGDLSINTDSHQVFRAGKAIDLTQREYELLTFLASHPNKVYSRIDLMEQGTGHRVLARLQLSGGDLQQRLSDHIAVLGDGEHIVPVVQGQNGHAVHMLYYLAERGPAVRQLHLVHVQAQEASLVLFLPAEGLLRQIRSLIHIAFHLVSIFCIFRTYSITLL